MVRSHALISSAVGWRPTPYVGNWACAADTHRAVTARSRAPTSRRGSDVDIGDVSVVRDLPALDGVVEEAGVQPTDLDQLGECRLDVTGLVAAARLENGLAAVPSPVEPEAGVSERQNGILQA